MKRGPKNVIKRDEAISFLVSTGLTFEGKPRYGAYVFKATDGGDKTFTLKAMRQEYIKAHAPKTPAESKTAPVVV